MQLSHAFPESNAPDSYLTRSERDGLFNNARTSLNEDILSEGFEAFCVRPPYAVDLDEPPAEAYWRAFSDYVQNTDDDTARATGIRTTEMAVRELLALVPLASVDHAILNSRDYIPDEVFQPAKRRASHFNRLILEVAERMPYMYVDELVGHILNMANFSVRNNAESKNTLQAYIRDIVYGIQHEFAFIQMAEAAGFTCEPAPEEEDVRGVDAHLWTQRGQRIDFDVKKGSHMLGARGALDNGFAVAEDGVVTTASGIHPDEFQGRFHVPDHVLRAKADGFRQYINRIALQLSARGTGRAAMRHYAVH